MTTLIDAPTQQDVAAEWMALDGADIKMNCASCNYKFPVQGIGGPSLICPICGFFPGKQSCRYIMDEFSKRRKRGEIAAAAEEPAEIAPSAAPPGLSDVIGNGSAVAQIRTALEAHRARAEAGSKAAFPHIFFVGPAGSGKSTLAAIVARECKHKLHEHLGQSLNDPRAMVAALLKLKAGDTLYIEECFPAGTGVDTPSGRVPIEHLRIGDIVYGERNGEIVTTKVKRLFRKPKPKTLICIDGVAMTANHPVWTDSGYTPAALVTKFDTVCHMVYGSHDENSLNNVRLFAATSSKIIFPTNASFAPEHAPTGEDTIDQQHYTHEPA